jgi:DNA polymerase III epsilon subunit-like protein
MNQPTTLYFDTETTGRPSSYTAHPKDWPRLVQIAWVRSNSEGRIFEKCSLLVQPDGFIIPEQATEIHGITTEQATKEGVPLLEAMTLFGKSWRASDVMCCHNVHFDLSIVQGESYRIWGKMPFSTKPHICTMKQTTGIVKAPKKDGKKGVKFPSLDELCQFCGVVNEKAHDALGDVLATWACHQYLIHNNHVLHGQSVEK